MQHKIQPEGPAAKLRRFIDDAGLTAAQAAKAVGVSGAAMSVYVRGLRAPEDLVRRSIERWTRGRIKRGEWETGAEREALANVVPFTTKKAG